MRRHILCVSMFCMALMTGACGDDSETGKTPDTGEPAVTEHDWYEDADADGYGNPDITTSAAEQPSGYVADNTDCDDQDANINPAATEVCNSVDDNCDGTVDEDLLTTFYQDADADGFGDADVSTAACEMPDGYVEDATDCDDTSADAYPGALEFCDGLDNDCDGLTDDDDDDVTDVPIWYMDSDADGYGNPIRSLAACDAPTGYVEDGTDCDDDESESFPGNVEICDFIDNDCDDLIDDDDDDISDALTWYEDADGDGYGDPEVSVLSCAPPSGFVEDDTDCNDDESFVFPGNIEICDEMDNDCDGNVDNDPVDGDLWYKDADGDGYGESASFIVACDQPSGYVEDDTDCDDVLDYVNPGAIEYCSDGVDDDCDDTDADIYPGADGWTDDCQPVVEDTGEPSDTAAPLDTGDGPASDTGGAGAGTDLLKGGGGMQCAASTAYLPGSLLLWGLLFIPILGRRRS